MRGHERRCHRGGRVGSDGLLFIPIVGGTRTPLSRVAGPAPDDLSTLLPDWDTYLRARNIALTTIASYLRCGVALREHLVEAGIPTAAGSVTRVHLEAFLAALTERVSPATVSKHYLSLQQLFRWLVDDGEIERSPMERMRSPLMPEQSVEVLTDPERKALLATCAGNTFENRRDTTLLRMLIDCGIRASELVGLGVADLDDE